MKWSFFAIILLLPTMSLAQEFNAGFVQGLWYSEETVFADAPVRVYVALRNNTGGDVTGTVEFFDNDERIGRSTVSALDGRIIESWVDWTPSYGEHTLSATITKVELHSVGADKEEITIATALAEDIVFVDYDTDGDGVGNSDDRDDDGDGISDAVEEKNGTDPLNPDDVPSTPTPEEDEEEERGPEEAEDNGPNTGLEQYLTPSRAEQTLAGITRYVNELKDGIDEYRETRNADSETNNPENNVEVNNGGFGEITRTEDPQPDTVEEPSVSKNEAEGEGGLVSSLIGMVGAIFSGVFSGALAALSFLLGYPALIQLLLLLAILYAMYRLAKKWGARPQ